MHKALLSLGALALLSACASQPKPATVADANKPQNCTSYMETGSLVPKRVCPTTQQQAADKQANQQSVQALQNAMRGHPTMISGAGGSGPPA